MSLIMSELDAQNTSRFVREFVTMALIPWMERCVAEWNDAVRRALTDTDGPRFSSSVGVILISSPTRGGSALAYLDRRPAAFLARRFPRQSLPHLQLPPHKSLRQPQEYRPRRLALKSGLYHPTAVWLSSPPYSEITNSQRPYGTSYGRRHPLHHTDARYLTAQIFSHLFLQEVRH